MLSAPFSTIDGYTPTPFNVHLGQGELTEIVVEHLARLGVEVRWSSRVTGLSQDASGVTVTVETADGSEELRAAWLVGADGGRSTVRELIGATLDGFTWDERFVATNLRADLRSLGFRSSNLYVHPTHACVIARTRSARGTSAGISIALLNWITMPHGEPAARRWAPRSRS